MNTSVTSGDDDLPEQPKVLLVDDDEVNLLLTSIALRERGFSVTEATSGEDAIQILSDWLPDVVVLDALMPAWTASRPAVYCAPCRASNCCPC